MKPTLKLNLARRPYVNRRILYAGYLVTIALLLTAIGGVSYEYFELRSMEKGLEEQLEDLKGQGEEVAPEISSADWESQSRQVELANRLLHQDAFRWTALLDHLETVHIKGISILSLAPDHRAGSLQLRGLARDIPSLRGYIDALIASPEFSEVLLLDHSRTVLEDSQKREAFAFSLELKGAF